MIEREITARLTELHGQYPVVTLTGPRQSGKTTLCRAALPDLRYLNLEAPDQRELAESDPRGFLARASEGAIIDEIQNVPELLSYIQVDVDERRRNGLYVLTGSHQFRLSKEISQSLAGRTALLRLLPLSIAERARTGAGMDVDEVIFSGFYPRILDQGLHPSQALGDYFETYVERDIRRSNEIRNISSFRRFVRMCAGRVGNLVNLSALGADVGVSHATAREWLTILEASYIVFRLEPYHANVGKRLIKSPKLYFYDVGLASFLIGIENASQLASHPLRGPLFENAVVVEALKHRYNRGRQPRLWFFRDARGLECDLLCETGRGIAAIEIKSGATLSADHFASLYKTADIIEGITTKTVVYGGEQREIRSGAEAVPMADLSGVLDRLDLQHDVSEFIQERRGPEPSRLDADRLHTIYRDRFRPVADGLDRHCEQLGAQLFRSHGPSATIAHGGQEFGCNLSDHSITQALGKITSAAGFRLRDDDPVRLIYRHRLKDYEGRGGGNFSVLLEVQWSAGSLSTLRIVSLDGVPVPRLRTVTPHDKPGTAARADGVVAATVTALLDRIDEQSRA